MVKRAIGAPPAILFFVFVTAYALKFQRVIQPLKSRVGVLAIQAVSTRLPAFFTFIWLIILGGSPEILQAVRVIAECPIVPDPNPRAE